MAVTLTDRAAEHVQRYIQKARQGRGPAPGRAHHRLLGPRLQARVRRRREARGHAFESNGVRVLSTRRASPTSTARSSTTCARA
jgi:hypothetical protein